MKFASNTLWNISLYKENVFLLTCTYVILCPNYISAKRPQKYQHGPCCMSLKGFFVIHSFWRLTLSILNLILHSWWSTVYFSTTVQWIRNVMFVYVVNVILRCRASCTPRNFVVSPIQLNLPIILIVYLVSFNKQYILAFADRLGF